MILLTAGTAYSAETSKEDTSDKVALTVEQSTGTETTKDEQPSFLVRHADTMKKISDGLYIAFPGLFCIGCIIDLLKEQYLKKKDEQTSFLVRHADKLKKTSDGVDIAFPVFFVIACILQPLEEQNLKNLAYNILTITMITKWVLDPTIKSVMSKKHAFELEALQAKLDAAQKKATEAA